MLRLMWGGTCGCKRTGSTIPRNQCLSRTREGLIPPKESIMERSNDVFHEMYEKVITPSDVGVVLAKRKVRKPGTHGCPVVLGLRIDPERRWDSHGPLPPGCVVPHDIPERIHSKKHLGRHEARNARAWQRSGGARDVWPKNTRDESAVRANERSPECYLSHDTVICFSEEESLFSSVVASSKTAPGIRNTSFSDKFQLLRANTWRSVDEMFEAANNEYTCSRPLRATMHGRRGRSFAQAIRKQR